MKQILLAVVLAFMVFQPTQGLPNELTDFQPSLLSRLVLDTGEMRDLLDPGSNNSVVVGSLNTGTGEYSSDEAIVDLATRFGHRSVPIFVTATCTAWNVDLDEAYIYEGHTIEYDCFPMGTAFLLRSDSEHAEWVTATHVIDEGISAYTAEIGIKIIPREFHIGLSQIPAEIVLESGEQTKLVSPSVGQVDAPEFARSATLGVGVKVYSLGTTRFTGILKTYIYRFVNEGVIVGVSRNFGGGDFVTTLGAIPGESGSPTFVQRDGEWLYAATVETSFYDSHKSGIVSMQPSIDMVHRAAPRTITPGLENEPEVDLEDIPDGGWENWNDLSTSEQKLWNEVRASNENYIYLINLSTKGIDFKTDTTMILIEPTAQLWTDFFGNASFPRSGKLSEWDDYISGWRLESITKI